MAEITTDLEYRLSGGASNSTPDLSLGGAMSTTTEITNATSENLFSNADLTEAADGSEKYRCFYIKKTGATTLTDAAIHIRLQTPSPDSKIYLAVAAAKNTVAGTIADEDTPPTSVVFVTPTDEGSALPIPDLTPNDTAYIWVRWDITANATGWSGDYVEFSINGTVT